MTARKKLTIARLPKELRDDMHYPRLGLAFIYIILLIAQLYSFEDFPKVVKNLGLPGDDVVANTLAIGLAFVELMTLPYLLKVSVYPKMIRISRILVVLLPTTWLILTSWAIGAGNTENAGLLGATISTPVHFLTIIIEMVLAGYALYVVYGDRLRLERTKSK